MAMTTAGASVKAEPNVTPMIDVMLVLLIIFMVVTPALLAGFNADPPKAVNLKDHPEDANLDQVLGIDRDGNYYLNKKPLLAPRTSVRCSSASTTRVPKTRFFISRRTSSSITRRCSMRSILRRKTVSA